MTVRLNGLIFGCGYVGRRVADAWLKAGRRVFAVTRSSTKASELRSSGIEPVIADVTDPESLAAARFPDVDTLLYAIGWDRSAGLPMHEVYVTGLQNAIAAVAEKTGRFLYISSTSVYGQDDGCWVDENAICSPTRENGQICLRAEQQIWDTYQQMQQGQSNRRRIVLRLAGIYGPGRLLARAETLKSGRVLSGNPDGWLNLIHVDDAVAAILAAEQCQTASGTYLVCDSEPVLRRDYYNALANLIQAPNPKFTNSSESTGLNKRCCNRRVREDLGVRLKFPSFREGLPNSLGDVV